MGFFSWMTQDTDESIPNNYSGKSMFTVYMHDHIGNVWKEDNYDGYGVFGGKDYYELLAEMNGLAGRDDGIKLAFANPPRPCLFPNLTRWQQPDGRNDWKYKNEAPNSCEFQGYFYCEDEEYIECKGSKTVLKYSHKEDEMDTKAAIRAYYEDLSREAPAKQVVCTLDHDRHVTLQWTSDMWEDGIPVTKKFNRNPPVSLRLSRGTILHGVLYEGLATSQDMFDFYLNGVWYSDEGAELLD